MNLIGLGFGGTAALVLSLGLASAPPESDGGYVTLGYGQSSVHVLLLGLTMGGAVEPPPEEPPTYGASSTRRRAVPINRLPMPNRKREDEELLILLL